MSTVAGSCYCDPAFFFLYTGCDHSGCLALNVYTLVLFIVCMIIVILEVRSQWKAQKGKKGKKLYFINYGLIALSCVVHIIRGILLITYYEDYAMMAVLYYVPFNINLICYCIIIGVWADVLFSATFINNKRWIKFFVVSLIILNILAITFNYLSLISNPLFLATQALVVVFVIIIIIGVYFLVLGRLLEHKMLNSIESSSQDEKKKLITLINYRTVVLMLSCVFTISVYAVLIWFGEHTNSIQFYVISRFVMRTFEGKFFVLLLYMSHRRTKKPIKGTSDSGSSQSSQSTPMIPLST